MKKSTCLLLVLSFVLMCVPNGMCVQNDNDYKFLNIIDESTSIDEADSLIIDYGFSAPYQGFYSWEYDYYGLQKPLYYVYEGYLSNLLPSCSIYLSNSDTTIKSIGVIFNQSEITIDSVLQYVSSIVGEPTNGEYTENTISGDLISYPSYIWHKSNCTIYVSEGLSESGFPPSIYIDFIKKES